MTELCPSMSGLGYLALLCHQLLAQKATTPGLGWKTYYATFFCASVYPLESRLIILAPSCIWAVVDLASGHILFTLGRSFRKPRKEQ